jgi:hypothetical protein
MPKPTKLGIYFPVPHGKSEVESHVDTLKIYRRNHFGGFVTNPHIRRLQEIGSRDAIDAIAEHGLAHDAEDIAMQGLKSLEEIGNRRAIQGIIWKGLTHSNEKIAAASREALKRMGDKAISELVKYGLKQDTADISEPVKSLLKEAGADAVPKLVRFMRATNEPSEVRRSAELLGDIGDESALVALMRHADHPDTSARREVKRAIRKIREAKRGD